MEKKNKVMVLGCSISAEPGQDQEIASYASIYSNPNHAMVDQAALHTVTTRWVFYTELGS